MLGNELTISSSLLPGWLIEPSPHIELPFFLEMLIWNHVVVLHHLGGSPAKRQDDSAYYTKLHGRIKKLAPSYLSDCTSYTSKE